MQFRLLSRSAYFIVVAAIQPIAVAFIAFTALGEVDDIVIIRVAISAGLIGAGSAVVYGAAEAIFMQRYTGTLETAVAAPAPYLAQVIGLSLAPVGLAVYSFGVAALIGVVRLGRIPELPYPGALMAGIAATIIAFLALGFLMASAYVLSRQAMEISNFLEYPFWILGGLLIPGYALPDVLHTAGLILSPLMWSTDAIDAALAGEPILLLVGVSLAYSSAVAGAGVLLMKRVLVKARVEGSLALR